MSLPLYFVLSLLCPVKTEVYFERTLYARNDQKWAIKWSEQCRKVTRNCDKS